MREFKNLSKIEENIILIFILFDNQIEIKIEISSDLKKKKMNITIGIERFDSEFIYCVFFLLL